MRLFLKYGTNTPYLLRILVILLLCWSLMVILLLFF
jgi:hypothetical protein